jgi:hypothetical protein
MVHEFGAIGEMEIGTGYRSNDRLCGLVVKSSWLQIQRPGFDSRNYQKKKVLGLERGPLSLVNTTEDLLDRKVAAPI